MRLFLDRETQHKVWAIRESGLGATAFVPGMKPMWEGWEDSAVPPERIGPYLRDFRRLMDRYGYQGALYGHYTSYIAPEGFVPLISIYIVLALTAASLAGTFRLVPPADYLPQGNRNLVFGLVIPPPGYGLAQREDVGLRIEAGMRPFFEAGREDPASPEGRRLREELPPVPTFDPIARPGSLEDYFRGRNTDGLDLATMFGALDPLSAHPGYRDRAARLDLMDRQGLGSAARRRAARPAHLGITAALLRALGQVACALVLGGVG